MRFFKLTRPCLGKHSHPPSPCIVSDRDTDDGNLPATLCKNKTHLWSARIPMPEIIQPLVKTAWEPCREREMPDLFPDLGKQSDVRHQVPGINSPTEAPGLQIQLFKAKKCHFYPQRLSPLCIWILFSPRVLAGSVAWLPSGGTTGLLANLSSLLQGGRPALTSPGLSSSSFSLLRYQERLRRL